LAKVPTAEENATQEMAEVVILLGRQRPDQIGVPQVA
jgi:hypothetical protein